MAVAAHHTTVEESELMSTRVLIVAVALLLVGAGLVHLAVVESHLSEAPLLGISFAVVGGLQVSFGFVVLGEPSRRLLYFIAVLSLGAVAAWAASRTVGLPVGSHQIPEPVGIADLVVVIFEILTLGAVVLLMVRPQVPARLSTRRWLVVAPLALAVAGMASTAVAVEGSFQDEHSHDQSVVSDNDFLRSNAELQGPVHYQDPGDAESPPLPGFDQHNDSRQHTGLPAIPREAPETGSHVLGDDHDYDNHDH